MVDFPGIVMFFFGSRGFGFVVPKSPLESDPIVGCCPRNPRRERFRHACLRVRTCCLLGFLWQKFRGGLFWKTKPGFVYQVGWCNKYNKYNKYYNNNNNKYYNNNNNNSNNNWLVVVVRQDANNLVFNDSCDLGERVAAVQLKHSNRMGHETSWINESTNGRFLKNPVVWASGNSEISQYLQ